MTSFPGTPPPSLDDLMAWSRPARHAALEALFALNDAPHKPLAAALCATDREDVRLDLSQAFPRLNADGFVVAVAVCLARGDAQVVSLVARQVAGRIGALEAATQDVVVERLFAARTRFHSPLVTETVDDALLSSSSPAAFADLLARLPSLSPPVGAKVMVRVLRQTHDELEVTGPIVVNAVVNNRRLYIAAVPLLVRICGVMGMRRARLFHAGAAILADDTVPLSDKLVVLAVVDVAFVWPIAVDLDVFLGLLDVALGQPRLTIIRTLGRLGTEDAANELLRLSASTEEDVALAAVAALSTWMSPLIDVRRSSDDTHWIVAPTYSDNAGVPLVLAPHSIRHPSTPQQYALDERGLVVPIGSSEEACSCCERPRLWVLRSGRRVCPRSRQVHPSSSSSITSSLYRDGTATDTWTSSTPTLLPHVAALAALRVVEFKSLASQLDHGQRLAGVVIADDGMRCAILTLTSRRRQWWREAPEQMRVVIDGQETVASRVFLDAPLAVYEADLSVSGLHPGSAQGVADYVAIRAPVRGLAVFVTRPGGRIDWGRIGVSIFGGSLLAIDDFASRPAVGTPIFDETGTLVALWDNYGIGDGIGVGVTLLWTLHARGGLVLGKPWPSPPSP